MDDLLKEFLVEAYDFLDQVDSDLLQLESDPTARSLWDGILRAMHTIKGTCGFLGLSHLEKSAHRTESFMISFRDGVHKYTSETTSILLQLIEVCRALMRQVEETGSDANDNLLNALIRTIDTYSDTTGEVAEPPAITVVPQTSHEGVKLPAGAEAGHDEPVASIAQCNQGIEPVNVAVNTVDTAKERVPAENKSIAENSAVGKNISETSIRVDVRHLNSLMDLVGELVLTRNRMLEETKQEKDRELIAATQRLGLITSELQQAVMRTRMQPVGSIWSKFPKVVRDISRQCGKLVRLEMEGQETELDRTLLEAIKDPLTHIVRNSVDHGIEDPVTRDLAGKVNEGTIYLSARHESGMVVVEIRDDGAGIDSARLIEKALSRGDITPGQAATMGEKEGLELIFRAGLSTAKEVTNISGRGVGMDVVRSNIEKVGGTVELASAPGVGTTITLRLPLTLAIIPALVISAQGLRFALPQGQVAEIARVGGDSGAPVEIAGGAPVFRLRKSLIPLLDLATELGITQAGRIAKPENYEGVVIIVSTSNEQKFGVLVDSVDDTQEIVVKPLSTHLSGCQVYLGATILGSGEVALIVDMPALATRLALSMNNTEAVENMADVRDLGQLREGLVICRSYSGQQIALSLALVERLEKIERVRLEQTSIGPVMQYRESVMPIVVIDELIYSHEQVRSGRPRTGEIGADQQADSYHRKFNLSEEIELIVCSATGGSIGVAVEEVLDVINNCSELDRSIDGEAGRFVVVNGQLAEFIDLQQSWDFSHGRISANSVDTVFLNT
ncbi:MAG: chemotaxis protein CheA [bacterium]|nr:chemotaxis protein CheA [bacterium]